MKNPKNAKKAIVAAQKYRSIEFVRYEKELPKREKQAKQINEHDILRAVLLAEDANGERWSVFRCEDRMHAIKAAHCIRGFGFNVEVHARGKFLYVRSIAEVGNE